MRRLACSAAGRPDCTAERIVTVDGMSSDARTVQLAPFEPAIFRKGVLNQDYSINDISNGAPANSIIQIFATGLSGQGTITANLAGREIPVPYYAGAAPGLLGVQQVDLVIPADLGPMSTQVYLCGTDTTGAKVCGLPAPVTLK